MGVNKREYLVDGKPVWYYQFRYEKQKYSGNGFETCSAAKKAEQAKLLEVQRGLHAKQTRRLSSEYLSFEQFLPGFIEHRKLTKAPRTAENERLRGQTLAKHFGDKKLRDISIADIQSYVAARKGSGISSRTINLELTFLRSLFKYAIQQSHVVMNPARDVTNLPPNDDQAEVWIPTEEEFQAFIDAAGATSNAKYLVPWLWFRAFTGTRPSESLFVEWSDIDFNRNQIEIRPKPGNPLKNRRKRSIPLHPELKPILLAWQAEWQKLYAHRKEKYAWKPAFQHLMKDHDWVFINPECHAARADGFGRSFREARRTAKLPRFNQYTTRHYFASQCIMHGISLYTIARWMGHKNTRMLEEVYAHLLPDYTADQMSKLKIVKESNAKVA